jgi:RNAPII transcription regulator C-terminal
MQALLVRGDPASMTLADHLFGLFSDPNISWDAASAIGRITASNTVLTKQNYAIVKVRSISIFFLLSCRAMAHPL